MARTDTGKSRLTSASCGSRPPLYTHKTPLRFLHHLRRYSGKLVVEREATSLKVTIEDHPEAGMSSLKYFTFQSFDL